ncbi:hypothetical protein M407DRAFT_31749 [Tulasnella calospora MUT 4182]|uniref:Uncharacterized protein n=1 Tax=Tulasnella calospora MUT 4182 TaxID=1051891 RepID=A0A0C3KB12_9AGAM|nr:hypothetical protein M407DRAFT_31749 [Tulasnella calospora MUT 4182]
MRRRVAANNAVNRNLWHNAMCCSITFADTRYKFSLEESHVSDLKNGIFHDPIVVNFHVASIGNRYAEHCDSPVHPVFILPSMCFAEWRKRRPTVTSIKLEISTDYDIFQSTHVAFPFYWSHPGRWLLVVLAGFGNLLGHEDPTAKDPSEVDFSYIIIDAQYSDSKPQYHPLLRSLRDFRTALVRLRLDVHHAAIAEASCVAPELPQLANSEHQALQPGYYLSWMLDAPDPFIVICRSAGLEQQPAGFSPRKQVWRQFLSFISVHTSIGEVNRTWRQRTAFGDGVAFDPGDSGEEEVEGVDSASETEVGPEGTINAA